MVAHEAVMGFTERSSLLWCVCKFSTNIFNMFKTELDLSYALPLCISVNGSSIVPIAQAKNLGVLFICLL